MKRISALILAAVMLCVLLTGCETVMPNAGHQLNRIVLSKSGKEGTVDETAPFPGENKYINPLSGQITDRDLSNVRPVGFMNNNIYQGTPQHGISNAELVFEMNAEGNVTRFLTIYQDINRDTPRIGSIRSARPYYLDWIKTFDCILVRAGGSETANNQIIRRGIPQINALVAGEPTFYRDQDRLNAGYSIEHTLFTTGERICDYFEAVPSLSTVHYEGFSCPFSFTLDPMTADGEDATQFTVYMNPNKRTLFEYDAENRRYLMTEYDRPMTDGNTGEQLAVRNVLVFFTSYRREYSGSSTLLADMSGGSGKYACDGKMVDISWFRTDEGLSIIRTDDTYVQLAVGHTFVCCADASSGSVLMYW